MRFRRVVFILLLLLAPAAATVAQSNAGVAARRVNHLRRGINTALWFAQARNDYNVERLRSFITNDDLQLIHMMGFDHIRLSVDATPLVSWEDGEPGGVAFMAELDRAIQLALNNKLAVIIDLQPEDPYKAALRDTDTNARSFALLWGALAAHFSVLDPERVFFELMNESEQWDDGRWRRLQTSAITEIRNSAPGFTVIASALHYDGLSDLLGFAPLADTNVIYSFHDYNPMTFTHQGATWAGQFLGPLHQIPYPSTPENVLPLLTQEPDLGGQFLLEQYGLERWDAQRIQTEISFARRWADQNHVPVYCGEFGVHRDVVEPAARYRWLHDMRVALEGQNIGWAMWDYQMSFGIVTKADGKTTPDVGVIEALGLKPVKSTD